MKSQKTRSSSSSQPLNITISYTSSPLFWFIILGLSAVLITWIVLAFTHSHHIIVVPDPIARDPPQIVLSRFTQRKRRSTHCRAGEFYDADAQMCGPSSNIPVAIENNIIDAEKKPCDSFYKNMCGIWINQHTNENRAFAYARYRNDALVKKIVTESGKADDTRAAYSVHNTPSYGPIPDFYNACVARLVSKHQHAIFEDILEEKHILNKMMGGVENYADLPSAFARLIKAGYTSPFSFTIERHPTENLMIPLITWDGFNDLTDDFVSLLYTQTQKVTNHPIWELEKRIQTVLKMTKRFKSKNIEPIEGISNYSEYLKGDGARRFQDDLTRFRFLPQWNALRKQNCIDCHLRSWNRFWYTLGGPGFRFHSETPFWIIGREYFYWLLNEGIREFSMREWQVWIEFSVLYNTFQFAPHLQEDVYFKKHDRQGPVGPQSRLYSRIPRINHKERLDKNLCIQITQTMIPGLVSRKFIDSYFENGNEVKQEVYEITQSIVEKMIERVNGTNWLDQESHEKVLEKLKKIEIHVAEPDTWKVEPFANRISQHRWAHNMNLVRRYRVERNLETWVNPFNRTSISYFGRPLSTVNAFYSGTTNSISIFEGVLNLPFYSIQFDKTSKYAIIGSIIGHELSHSLDPNGIQFDASGKFNPVLSENDYISMLEKLKCIQDEYKAPEFCSVPNYGKQTQGEDVADLFGVDLAYRALFESLIGETLDMGHKQRFFMAFAQIWCASYDVKHECDLIQNDVHAISEFRVDNTLKNLDEFHKAFNCKEGDGMYKSKEEVCKIF